MSLVRDVDYLQDFPSLETSLEYTGGSTQGAQGQGQETAGHLFYKIPTLRQIPAIPAIPELPELP